MNSVFAHADISRKTEPVVSLYKTREPDNSMTNNDFPLAMDPPEGDLTIVTSGTIHFAVEMSRKSPRKRIICPFHKSAEDSLHRMLNAIQPNSYIQPHRHADPPKAETLILLKGALAYIAFDSEGQITEKICLTEESGRIGIDTESGIYHTFFALEEDTVLFEVKPGPYIKAADKEFASWAPAENAVGSTEYLESLYAYVATA